MSITYFECVSVAIIIQHAKHMRLVILSSVACLSLPYFIHIISRTTLFSKVKKKKIEHKMCFDFLYDLCMKYLSF